MKVNLSLDQSTTPLRLTGCGSKARGSVLIFMFWLLYPMENSPSIQWVGGWMCCRASLDTVMVIWIVSVLLMGNKCQTLKKVLEPLLRLLVVVQTISTQDTSISIREVGAQGDPCIATIFWSVVHPHLLYSASSPIPLTKYSILHNGISS
jgi:hypothetical protein